MPVIYNRLPKIAAAARPMVERAVGVAAYNTEALAKFNAPVDTGNLRNSIATSQVRPLTWRVTASADYALYVEMGWQRGSHRQAGRFYLTNALRESWSQLNGVIGKEFGL